MPYVGNQPSGNFVQVTSQTITGNGGSTYTLDRPAGNSAELRCSSTRPTRPSQLQRDGD